VITAPAMAPGTEPHSSGSPTRFSDPRDTRLLQDDGISEYRPGLAARDMSVTPTRPLHSDGSSPVSSLLLRSSDCRAASEPQAAGRVPLKRLELRSRRVRAVRNIRCGVRLPCKGGSWNDRSRATTLVPLHVTRAHAHASPVSESQPVSRAGQAELTALLSAMRANA
jgi:hypothetical protein